MLQRFFALSDAGTRNLRLSITLGVIINLFVMVPLGLSLYVLQYFLARIIQQGFKAPNAWAVVAAGAAFIAVLFILEKLKYGRTYNGAYEEAANVRISLAESLRKLPLSYFGRQDLSYLTSTLLNDVTTIEQAFSNVVPEMFGGIISILIAAALLAFLDWRMTIALFVCAFAGFFIVVGCGKSTIARLAARFWDASSGTVSVGGVDVSTVEPETLLGAFSIVFQDVVLFNDTVYNNILIGNRNATKEQVLAAAKAAQCESFIEKLPQGYDTEIGENGYTLSGGERQRLSIARALLKDAPIILLDEATAALDPENETLIQHAIGTLIKGKTVIVIAHRLRTVENADKIIVLNKGTIAETGTHAELMEKDGIYREMYRLQRESDQWSA